MAKLRLRAWQAAALEAFEATDAVDFLCVATPGAGKTTFALAAAIRALAAERARRVVVVCPTQHLKVQWASAAERLGLAIASDWSASDGTLPEDWHGAVVTYQQVASNPGSLLALARRSFVVLDEIHHAGDSRAWGDAVRLAFGLAARRLALSGTPFRSDKNPIPFVTYDDGVGHADFEYGYGDALADRSVVRPVYFPRIGGQMEWTAPDGTFHSHTFEDAVKAEVASQRLRTALSVDGEWLPAVLSQAHAQLLALRETDSAAGGLVIAMDQAHAREIQSIIRDRFGVEAIVAVSDDPEASRRIARFSAAPHLLWIIAVRMVSEGVDIPRLRVGVYATNTVTDLFFRQAVGRLVRWTSGQGNRRQSAYMFIPDDARLRGFAWSIKEAREHRLRAPVADDSGEALDDPMRAAEAELAREQGGAEPQLSLFDAISAVPLDAAGMPYDHTSVLPEDPAEVGLDVGVIDLPHLTLARRAASMAPGAAGAPSALMAGGAADAGQQSLRDRRRDLRERNSRLAKELAQLTGLGHAAVNSELNRLSGIRRVTEATEAQLAKRIEAAEAWVRRL